MNTHHIEWIISAISVAGGLLLGWKSKLPVWADMLIMVCFLFILFFVRKHLIP